LDSSHTFGFCFHAAFFLLALYRASQGHDSIGCYDLYVMGVCAKRTVGDDGFANIGSNLQVLFVFCLICGGGAG
jgi:hypothetical protein